MRKATKPYEIHELSVNESTSYWCLPEGARDIHQVLNAHDYTAGDLFDFNSKCIHCRNEWGHSLQLHNHNLDSRRGEQDNG